MPYSYDDLPQSPKVWEINVIYSKLVKLDKVLQVIPDLL